MPNRNLALLLLAATAMCACVSHTPYLDAHFGEAVNTAKAMQTLNPDASKSTALANGLEGPAAANATGRYYDSFKAPVQTFTVIDGTQ